MTVSTKRHLNEKEVEQEYPVTTAWLRRARWAGGGPRFVKMPGRAGKVFYEREELDRFFASRVRSSTSDPGPSTGSFPKAGGRGCRS